MFTELFLAKPFGAGNFFGGIFTFGKIRSKTRFEGSHLFFGIFYRFVRRGLNLFQNRRDRRRRITEEVERNPGHQLSVGGRTEAEHSRNQQDSEIKFFIFLIFSTPRFCRCVGRIVPGFRIGLHIGQPVG